MQKKKHTVRNIFLIILAILLVLLVVFGIKLFLKWKDAQYLEKNVDLQHFTYEIRVKLDRGKVPADTADALAALAEVTGLAEESFYDLRMVGGVDGSVIYMKVYPKGAENPITELYLSKDGKAVNGADIYKLMRKHYVEGKEGLDLLFPVWNDHEYMTPEQMEQMLETDLSILSDLSVNFADIKLLDWQYFVALVLMDRGKEGYVLTGADDISAKISMPKDQAVSAEATVKQPGQVIAAINKKLSKVGFHMDTDKLEMIESISMELSFGEKPELKIPDDTISQTWLNVVKGVRTAVRKLSGK